MPTIVVESGWSESRKKLHDDMRIWINGGRPFIQMVFVIKWTRGSGSNNNLVRGDIEIFRLGTAGPISVQKEVSRRQPAICFAASFCFVSFVFFLKKKFI